MNLHGIVSGAIGVVNPNQFITLAVSTGSTKDASFKQVPTYASPVRLSAQVQDLSTSDVRQLDALNIQSSSKVIFVSGLIEGVVRPTQKGGDLITLADGSKWLTTVVLEQWPDWCKVAATMQMNP